MKHHKYIYQSFGGGEVWFVSEKPWDQEALDKLFTEKYEAQVISRLPQHPLVVDLDELPPVSHP